MPARLIPPHKQPAKTSENSEELRRALAERERAIIEKMGREETLTEKYERQIYFASMAIREKRAEGAKDLLREILSYIDTALDISAIRERFSKAVLYTSHGHWREAMFNIREAKKLIEPSYKHASSRPTDDEVRHNIKFDKDFSDNVKVFDVFDDAVDNTEMPNELSDIIRHWHPDLDLSDEQVAAWGSMLDDIITALPDKADEITAALTPVLNPPELETASIALPEKAPKLYVNRPEGQNIIDFLRDPDGWGPYIQARVLTRPYLRQKDEDAYDALTSWLQRHDNKLPEDLPLPKRGEIANQTIDKIAAAAGVPQSSIRRAGQTLAQRAQRSPR